jgi:hypothetical protein
VPLPETPQPHATGHFIFALPGTFIFFRELKDMLHWATILLEKDI